jgi:hypothetical protein
MTDNHLVHVGLENAPLARKERDPCSFTPSHGSPLDPTTDRAS